MGTVRLRGRARTAWGHLSQDGLLKPTALWDLMSATINEFWPEATGLSGNDFLAKTDCRTLLLQVCIERTMRPVADERELVVEVDTDLGAVPGSGNQPPRYGGIDRVRLHDGQDGDVVGQWTARWLWFRAAEDGGVQLLHEPAPGLVVDQDDALDALERPPRLADPITSSRFRWAARETDTNDHVFSLCYLERAENALADLEVDTAGLHRWQVWYLRPSFSGEAMSAEVERAGDGWLVALRNDARDEVSAVVRTGGAS